MGRLIGYRWVKYIPYVAVVLIVTQLLFDNLVVKQQLKADEIGRRIDLSIRSVEGIVEKWHSGEYSEHDIDSLWSSHLGAEADINSPALILFSDDTVRYWQGEIPSGEVFNLGSSSTIDSLPQSVVLSFSRSEGRTRSLIIVPLLGLDGIYNDYLFPFLRRAPKVTAPRADGLGNLVEVRGKSFTARYMCLRQISYVINIMGWMGVFLVLYYIRVRVGRRATPENILRKVATLAVLFTIARIILYNVEVPQGASNSWSSLSSLLVTYIILYLFFELPYMARFKLRRKMQSSSVVFRYVMIVIFSVIVSISALYLYRVSYNVIHETIGVVSLKNMLELDLDLVLVYVVYAILSSIVVVYCLAIAVIFSSIDFKVRMLIHIVIFIISTIIFGYSLVSALLLATIISLMIVIITNISTKRSAGALFLIVVLFASTYASIFTIVETNASHLGRAREYADLLLKNGVDNTNIPTGVWYVEIGRSGNCTAENSRYEVGVIDRLSELSDNEVAYLDDRVHVYTSNDSRVVIVSMRYYGVLEALTLWCYITLILLFICSSIIQLSAISVYSMYNRHSLIYRVRAALFFSALISVTASLVFVVYMLIRGEHSINSRALGNTTLELKAALDSSLLQDEVTLDRVLDWVQDPLNKVAELSVGVYGADYRLRYSYGSLELGTLLDDELYAQLLYDGRFVSEMVIEGGDRVEFAVPIIGNDGVVAYLVVAARNYAVSGMRVTFWSHVQGGIVNLSIAVLLFSLLISIILYRRISKPLRVLYDGVSKIGDLRKINAVDSELLGNEIGAIIIQYNSMVEYIHSNYKQIIESEREGAWREAARQIAHEIKNPLTPMKLRIELMQYYRQADPERFNRQMDDALELLKNNVDILSNIASDLSDIARTKAGEFHSADICKVLTNVSSLYGSMGSVRIRLKGDMESTILVKADYVSLSRVFLNLIKNASEAMQWSGVVDVDLSVKGSMVVVEVRDRGPGLSEENLQRLFKYNFSTKVNGSGLGLTICKGIVIGYGGTITARNHSDGGAVFTVSLPRC